MFIINNKKGVFNMNNIKKIGLSALAGSLVAFSANAAEMSISGHKCVHDEWCEKCKDNYVYG